MSCEKNRVKRNSDKYRTNIMGFQAINGKSLIKFIDNSKMVPMIQFMVDIRVLNINNKELGNLINNAVYNENLSESNIIYAIKKLKIDRNKLESKIKNRFKLKT